MRKSSGSIPAGDVAHVRTPRGTASTQATPMDHSGEMSRRVQLRRVPGALYRALKERAVAERSSVLDLLIREAQRVVERPTMAEFLERLEKRTKVHAQPSPTEIIRQERDKR